MACTHLNEAADAAIRGFEAEIEAFNELIQFNNDLISDYELVADRYDCVINSMKSNTIDGKPYDNGDTIKKRDKVFKDIEISEEQNEIYQMEISDLEDSINAQNAIKRSSALCATCEAAEAEKAAAAAAAAAGGKKKK